MVLCLEGWSEGCHLVYDAAKGPDVALLVVLLLVYQLWTHIVGCANMSVSKHGVLIHDTGETEVAQFRVVSRV